MNLVVTRMMPSPSCPGWRTGAVPRSRPLRRDVDRRWFSSFVGVISTCSIGIVVKEIDHLGTLGDGRCRWFSIVLVLLLVVAATVAAAAAATVTSPKVARPPTAVATTAASAAVHRWRGCATKYVVGIARMRMAWMDATSTSRQAMR